MIDQKRGQRIGFPAGQYRECSSAGTRHTKLAFLHAELGQLVLHEARPVVVCILASGAQQPADLGQRESNVAKKEDHAHLGHRRLGVPAAPGCAGGRVHEPEVVVVPQGGGGDARPIGQLADRQQLGH
jgi:hypothetical protein